MSDLMTFQVYKRKVYMPESEWQVKARLENPPARKTPDLDKGTMTAYLKREPQSSTENGQEIAIMQKQGKETIHKHISHKDQILDR